MEWIRFSLVLLLLAGGLGIFFLELFGVFRFRFVLNRMQVAAMGDTLGISLCILGLIVANGLNATSAKMVLVIVFLWFASPVSSHMIAKLEYITDEGLDEHCRILELKDLQEETTNEGESQNEGI